VELLLYVPLFLLGVYLVVQATERFVEGLLGSAVLSGVSAFALGVVFGGFDPENLAAGIAGGVNDLPGVALGTVLGSSVFLLTIALGVAGVLVPLRVEVPRSHIFLTLASPVPLLLLSLDNELSRWDGLVLLVLFFPAMGYILAASRGQHRAYLHKDEVDEVVKEREKRPRWFFPALMVGGLAVIAGAAQLVGWTAHGIVDEVGISDTVFGMVFVAAAVSFEEIARETVPAYRGHPEISIGNILGTVLFFVLFNIGIIAMIAPLAVDDIVLTFYWPFLMGTLAVVSVFLLRKSIGRPEGAILLAIYPLYLALAVLLD